MKGILNYVWADNVLKITAATKSNQDCYFYHDERYSDDRWNLIGVLRNEVVIVSYKWPEQENVRVLSMKLAEKRAGQKRKG